MMNLQVGGKAIGSLEIMSVVDNKEYSFPVATTDSLSRV